MRVLKSELLDKIDEVSRTLNSFRAPSKTSFWHNLMAMVNLLINKCLAIIASS
jgi:hypothetical protein